MQPRTVFKYLITLYEGTVSVSVIQGTLRYNSFLVQFPHDLDIE